MKKLSLIIIAICLFAGSLASASETVWLTDFELAKATAKIEDKNLLVNFTGSDWCYWCKKLKKEVLGKLDFTNEIKEKFILVEIDFPENLKQSQDIKDQNEKLSNTYNIDGFPTILLIDDQGKPYAKTGYIEGGVNNYLKHLDQFELVKNKRDECFAAAEYAKGTVRAGFLDEALTLLDENGINTGYSNLIKEIMELDSQNKAGLKQKYEYLAAKQGLNQILNSVSITDDYRTGAKQIDNLIQKVQSSKEIVQELYIIKANLFMSYDEDIELVKDTLLMAYQAYPNSKDGKDIKDYLAQIVEE